MAERLEMDNFHETGTAPAIANRQTGEEVRRAREAANMTQTDIVRELARMDVEMSVSTLSRSESGAREFKKAELQAIGEVLKAEIVALRPAEISDPKPPHRVREFLRRHAIIIGVSGALIGALGLLGMIATLNGVPLGNHSDARSTATGCNHYRIAAQDLWLRDQYGETVEQLPHDLDVTYLGKQNRAGHWEITATDGRHGWVDSSFLKPQC
ncbi:helix-turn-helix domain-containing protein [Nonomuraea sp. NPDC049028]|uniref:helix-turn-helix domain-containing protein n=1 Tax=Nonomuraea sp. NPDC049028 TaxID=3364348 RepID=UPI003711EAB2